MWMVSHPPGTWMAGLLGAIYSGLIAICWASIFIFRKFWYLVPLIICQGTLPPLFFMWSARAQLLNVGSSVSPQGRLLTLAIMTLAFIILGYFLIIRYTELQERDATRHRTELDLAAGIHRTLVPAIDVSTPTVHIIGRSVPSSQMGGDLIDVVTEGARVDVYLADVSGHGVKAGVVMAMVKAAIRMRLRNASGFGGLLADLDAVLQQTIEPGMFATFACMRFTANPGGPTRASFALAGHLPILLCSPQNRTIRDLPNDALPLGVGEDEIYSEQDLLCQSGDTFLLLTDGLTEVMGADGRQMGLERIRARFAELIDRPLPELHQSLLDMARNHGKQIDDQTLLLVRVN